MLNCARMLRYVTYFLCALLLYLDVTSSYIIVRNFLTWVCTEVGFVTCFLPSKEEADLTPHYCSVCVWSVVYSAP